MKTFFLRHDRLAFFLAALIWAALTAVAYSVGLLGGEPALFVGSAGALLSIWGHALWVSNQPQPRPMGRLKINYECVGGPLDGETLTTEEAAEPPLIEMRGWFYQLHKGKLVWSPVDKSTFRY